MASKRKMATIPLLFAHGRSTNLSGFGLHTIGRVNTIKASSGPAQIKDMPSICTIFLCFASFVAGLFTVLFTVLFIIYDYASEVKTSQRLE